MIRIDSKKCIGCGQCVDFCPNDVPKMVDAILVRAILSFAKAAEYVKPFVSKTQKSFRMILNSEAVWL